MTQNKYSLAIFVFWAISVISMVAPAAPKEPITTSISNGQATVAQDLRCLEEINQLNGGSFDANHAGIVSEADSSESIRIVHLNSARRSILAHSQN